MSTIVPFAGAVTVTTKTAAVPGAMFIAGQVRVLPTGVIPLVALTKTTPEGNASCTTTFVAVVGPRLVAVMV